MAFDLLHHERRALTGRPLRDRRARLEDLVAGSELIFPVRRLAATGLDAWAQVIERGYEGLVAEDEASLYQAGPTTRWLKVKQEGLEPSPTTAGSGGSARRRCLDRRAR
jgi:ATP-dependent DNA ligase